MKTAAVPLLLALALPAAAAEPTLPLPEAAVRVFVPDIGALDAALTGSFRAALSGQLAEDDPVARAWRRSQVGTKLEAQWGKLAEGLPWTWEQLRAIKPGSLGLALLEVGHLEAVLVIETPLLALPVAPKAGVAKSHAGIAYQLVARGAGDGGDDKRRMGLAWCRSGGRFFVATSERALKLALDAALAGSGVRAPLPGLVSVDLDLDALRKDRYYRREFLFGDGPETGHVRAALRLQAGQLVEVREGTGEPRPAGLVFDVPGAVAQGWEPDGAGLWPALRAGLLEPIPKPSDKPVVPIAPLPAAQNGDSDPYLVSLERPLPGPGTQGEEGELAAWRELWAKRPAPGWGFVIAADGARSVVFTWPAASHDELVGLLRATLERRASRVTVSGDGDTQRLSVGPDLPVLAVRRVGDCVWIGPTAEAVATLPAPRPAGDLVRWARVDLGAVRAESPRWAKAEGPASPETIRPLSDRVLGLLGWLPATRALSVERRRSAAGWTERVVFESGGKP